jgi:1,4-alpha-glucan branching enzyme
MYTYMFTHPGTKLLFMGGEFAQTSEWNYKSELSWGLLQYAPHKGMQQTVKELNALYRAEPALYEKQFDYEGFEWNDLSDHQNCVLIYYRKGKKTTDTLLVVLNMTPVPRENYTMGVFASTAWKEIFNSDAGRYWGSGVVNTQSIKTHKEPHGGKENSIRLTLPPLGAVVLKQAD